MKKDLLKRILGLVLVLLTVGLYQIVYQQICLHAAGWLFPFLAVWYCLMALGLWWMGVLQARFPAWSYLIAAIGVAVFYLLAGLHHLHTSYDSVLRLLPMPEGGLLFGLCLVLGVQGLARRGNTAGSVFCRRCRCSLWYCLPA